MRFFFLGGRLVMFFLFRNIFLELGFIIFVIILRRIVFLVLFGFSIMKCFFFFIENVIFFRWNLW